jgi:hypothetical protein
VFCLTLSSVTSYPNPVSQSSQREPFDWDFRCSKAPSRFNPTAKPLDISLESQPWITMPFTTRVQFAEWLSP